MQKKDILEKSRNENKNKDLVDIEISAQAGNIAGRVGACVCCLISLIFYWITNTPLLSPWIIYFSILGTHYLVKYIKIKRKSDLVITILYFAMCLLALFFFGMKLMEVSNYK